MPPFEIERLMEQFRDGRCELTPLGVHQRVLGVVRDWHVAIWFVFQDAPVFEAHARAEYPERSRVGAKDVGRWAVARPACCGRASDCGSAAAGAHVVVIFWEGETGKTEATVVLGGLGRLGAVHRYLRCTRIPVVRHLAVTHWFLLTHEGRYHVITSKTKFFWEEVRE